MGEVVILDYSAAQVVVFKLPEPNMEYTEIEDFLESKGFRLGDCEWMSTDRITIEDRR